MKKKLAGMYTLRTAIFMGERIGEGPHNKKNTTKTKRKQKKFPNSK